MTPTTELTREEKRVKIAEACGWKKDYPACDEATEEAILAWRKPDGSGPWCDGYLPHYFGDLNACHEMEKALGDKCGRYFATIQTLVPKSYSPENPSIENFFIHATAAQRAEAFGLTMGLWTANREEASK